MNLRKAGAVVRLGVLLAGGCMAATTHADDIYFTITGATQGKIVGEMVGQKGIEGAMRGTDFTVKVQDNNGQLGATVSRQMEVATLIREAGRGSAQLFHAYVTRETLTSVKIDFYTPRAVSGSRVMVLYQSIKLTNAKVTSFVRRNEPAKDATSGLVRSLEEVRLTYQSIDIIDQDASLSATLGIGQ